MTRAELEAENARLQALTKSQAIEIEVLRAQVASHEADYRHAVEIMKTYSVREKAA